MKPRNEQKKIEIYNYINGFIKEYGVCPSIPEIADGVRLAKSTTHKYLVRLEEEGYIEKYGRNQILTRENSEPIERIPVVGAIACGNPKLAVEDIEMYIPISKEILGEGEYKVNAINEENRLAPSRKKEIFDYILSGKLICGDCKHRMGGESGTSHTGAIHYYYICLSKRRKRAKCNMGRVQKQFIEDTVINATTQMLSSVNNIKKIAQSIYNVHKKETADNTALKLIEKKRAEAVKAQNNIVKAIEQGIITETTKSRLTELENLISQYDIEICKEKARSYTFLTADDIEMYLSKFVFDNTDDIKVRKLLVNAFIREVILYDDEIVITYNFTDSPEHLKLTKEHVTKTEKEIETADKTAISSNTGSYKLCHTAPKQYNPNQIIVTGEGFGFIIYLRISEQYEILSL